MEWVDLFTSPIYKRILIESFEYCNKHKGLNVHAYVIMTNHLHAIVSSQPDFKLQATIRDYKKYTSKKLIEAIDEFPESRRVCLLQVFRRQAQRTNRGVNYRI